MYFPISSLSALREKKFMKLNANWYAENENILLIASREGIGFGTIGFSRRFMTNMAALETIGFMVSAYIPAPEKAAVMAAMPAIPCTHKLRTAIKRNLFSLNSRALGTMFKDANSRLSDRSWHIGRRTSV